jgi:hypothetical protein
MKKWDGPSALVEVLTASQDRGETTLEGLDLALQCRLLLARPRFL